MTAPERVKASPEKTEIASAVRCARVSPVFVAVTTISSRRLSTALCRSELPAVVAVCANAGLHAAAKIVIVVDSKSFRIVTSPHDRLRWLYRQLQLSRA